MSNDNLKYIIQYLLFVLVQGLFFGQLEFGWGIHPMIYPIFILLLPFETPAALLMLIGFITGISVDFFMNTFGLHASAAILVAYLRPFIYGVFAPRDGYDSLKKPTLFENGFLWFFSSYGVLISIHHLVFFSLEIFRLSDFFLIIQKTILSSIITLSLIVLIQFMFFRKEKVI